MEQNEEQKKEQIKEDKWRKEKSLEGASGIHVIDQRS